jgi:hypothetical protein
VHDGESEDENVEDDTLFQYYSEDEGGATTEVDSDDEYLFPTESTLLFSIL